MGKGIGKSTTYRIDQYNIKGIKKRIVGGGWACLDRGRQDIIYIWECL